MNRLKQIRLSGCIVCCLYDSCINEAKKLGDIVVNICLYTENKNQMESESEIIKSFFTKYKTKCSIRYTLDYRDIIDNIRKIDIIFIYEDVWENAYKIIESLSDDTDHNREVYIVRSQYPTDIEKLESNKNKLLPKDKVIHLKAKNEIIRISSKRILYFENIKRTVYVHTIDGVFEITSHIRELEKDLEKDYYISCYVSILVNFYWIKDITGYEITLKNGIHLPLSQKKSASFRKKYKEYLEMMG